MQEDERKYKDILDIDGEIAVAVVSNKDEPKKRDIILLSRDNDAKSERSITELANDLKKKEVPFDKIEEAMDFVSRKLSI